MLSTHTAVAAAPAAGAATLLEVRDLHARYGANEVLHGIDLDVREGAVTALLGANGAGKTTTLRALCQFMVTTTGSVRFEGRPLEGRSTEQIAALGIGHVPDGRGTFLALSAEENLRLGAHRRRDAAGIRRDLEQLYEHFPRLRERRGQQAGTLSGGEQQMLAIGRALMARPRLLLLDEPSFGLAPLVVKDIFSIMRRISTEQRMTILVVEQNVRMALDLAEHAYVLAAGRIALGGPSRELRHDAAVRRSYLGE